MNIIHKLYQLITGRLDASRLRLTPGTLHAHVLSPAHRQRLRYLRHHRRAWLDYDRGIDDRYGLGEAVRQRWREQIK